MRSMSISAVQEQMKLPNQQSLVTELRDAAISGNSEKIAELKLQFIEVDVCDAVGKTPLMHAAFWGHEDAVIALKSCSNLLIRDKSGKTALDYASTTLSKFAIMHTLKQQYLAAAAKADIATVSTCLYYGGIKVEDENDAQETALTIAAKAGHVEVVELLVTKFGAFLSESALEAAIVNNYPEIVRKMLILGAAVSRNLYLCAYGANNQAAEMTLSYYANPINWLCEQNEPEKALGLVLEKINHFNDAVKSAEYKPRAKEMNPIEDMIFPEDLEDQDPILDNASLLPSTAQITALKECLKSNGKQDLLNNLEANYTRWPREVKSPRWDKFLSDQTGTRSRSVSAEVLVIENYNAAHQNNDKEAENAHIGAACTFFNELLKQGLDAKIVNIGNRKLSQILEDFENSDPEKASESMYSALQIGYDKDLQVVERVSGMLVNYRKNPIGYFCETGQLDHAMTLKPISAMNVEERTIILKRAELDKRADVTAQLNPQVSSSAQAEPKPANSNQSTIGLLRSVKTSSSPFAFPLASASALSSPASSLSSAASTANFVLQVNRQALCFATFRIYAANELRGQSSLGRDASSATAGI